MHFAHCRIFCDEMILPRFFFGCRLKRRQPNKSKLIVPYGIDDVDISYNTEL